MCGSQVHSIRVPTMVLQTALAQADLGQSLLNGDAVAAYRREAFDALVGGASRSKRLARAFVVCARGSQRVSE